MRRRAGSLVAALALAPPAIADTDFTTLSATERVIFHAEIRAALLSVPHLLPDAPPVVIEDPYAQARGTDLARIARHSARLFAGGARLAVFTAPDCKDCARALQDLRDISGDYGVTFTQFSLQTHQDIATDLGLTEAPAYVFADRMFQGWMPRPVLERYLTE